jgi:S1-C subfamily serine protease
MATSAMARPSEASIQDKIVVALNTVDEEWYTDVDVTQQEYEMLVALEGWRPISGRSGAYYRQTRSRSLVLVPLTHYRGMSGDRSPNLAALNDPFVGASDYKLRAVNRSRDRDLVKPRKQAVRVARKAPTMSGATGRISTGTAFAVSDRHLVTNAHVVTSSNVIEIWRGDVWVTAEVEAIDEIRDLALLTAEHGGQVLQIAKVEPELGDGVYTVGFPNFNVQGYSPKYTSGEVSSLLGMRDNPMFYQVSIPIQPGNSGGPLVDGDTGEVQGVITSRLNDMDTLRQTGAMPQNVNYALNRSVLMAFIREEGVPLKLMRRKGTSSTQDTMRGVFLVKGTVDPSRDTR